MRIIVPRSTGSRCFRSSRAQIQSHLASEFPFEGLSWHIRGQFSDYQNLIVTAKINPVLALSRDLHANELRSPLAKSRPAPVGKPRSLAAKRGIGNYFLEKLRNER
jgi:hypothetical protein